MTHYFRWVSDTIEPDFSGVAVTGAAAEPDDPRPEIIINPTLTLTAHTTPREAADLLRATYTAEWIADLLVCLLSRTAGTETL